MQGQQKLSVDGFVFFTEKDAGLAAAERKKIEYLEARVDYTRPESILSVYKSSIEKRIFRTPVGLEYLKGLREFLLAQPDADPQEIPDIPLYCHFSNEIRETSRPAKSRVKPLKGEDPEEKRRFRYRMSVMLNMLLILAIAAMFMITLRSDNPNVLNYERVLTDKYASWEQELTERESELRARELELDRKSE